MFGTTEFGTEEFADLADSLVAAIRSDATVAHLVTDEDLQALRDRIAGIAEENARHAPHDGIHPAGVAYGWVDGTWAELPADADLRDDPAWDALFELVQEFTE